MNECSSCKWLPLCDLKWLTCDYVCAMKTNGILLTSLLLLVGVPGAQGQPTTARTFSGETMFTQKEAKWASARDYILQHATYADTPTLNRFKSDVDAGVVTWESSVIDKINPSLDGGNVGWPQLSLVLSFSTIAELNQASNLVLGATQAPGQ